MKGPNKFQKLLENRSFQTVYLIVLIVLVPAMIIFNTLVLLKNFQETVNLELQRKAYLVTNLLDFNQDLEGQNYDEINFTINRVAENIEEIEGIDVLIPNDRVFSVVASLDNSAIGYEVEQVQLDLAWSQNEGISHQTNSPSSTAIEIPVDGSPKFTSKYWVVTKPILDVSGERLGLISVKMSSKQVDSLVKVILRDSYILLTLTILLTIAVLAGISQIFKSEATLMKKVNQLDSVKSKFITVVSHVMRTPLTSMRWNLELLLSGNAGVLSKEQEPLLRSLYKSNINILQTIQDLNVAINIEQNTLSVKKEAVKVLPLIESTIIQLKPQTVAKEIEIKVHDYSKEKMLVNADPLLLQQVIASLLDNAIKYSYEGQIIKIGLNIEGNTLLISVSDHGIGVANNEKDKIFLKFYRGRKAMRMYTDAAGLGLFVGKLICEAHGGSLNFVSVEGEGSTFTARFPLQ